MTTLSRVLGLSRAASVAAFAVLGVSLFGASAASAETCTAKNTSEFTACVAKTNAKKEANTIVLAGGGYIPTKTLTFTNTSGTLTIEGPAGSPTVKSKAASITGGSVEPPFSSLFIVEAGVTVNLDHIEVGGSGGNGTAAIEVLGNLGLEDSVLEGNSGDNVLIEPEATLTARNSTISESLEFGIVDEGSASLVNSTVAFNEIGGIENKGTLNLTNTIVAENKDKGDCVGKATSSDHSLDSDGSCDVGALSKTNPLLQPALLNIGGTTPVHSLEPTSPAIGAGDEGKCPTADQRGALRGNPCSLGADEFSTTPPTIKVPAKITVPEESPSGAEVPFEVTATGVNNAVISLTCTPLEPGALFPVGVTKVTCTAVDGHENKATASFEVEVTPKVASTGPPTVTVPADITTTATGASGTVVSYMASAEAAAGTTIATFGCTPASGSTFAIATTTVTCTAVASNSKETKASFTVTVKDAAPVISGVPADISTEATGASGAAVSYTNPTATDFADGTDPVLCTPASGSTFAITTTTVKCTATNAAGLEATASFTVTVTPKAPPAGSPTVTVPADITTTATGASGAVVSYTATATPAPETTVTSFGCTPASGSTFAIATTTVTCTAVGSNSKETKASFTVTVKDAAPVISGVPADISTEATGASGAAVSYTNPTATDFADGTDPVLCTPASGSTFAITTTTVKCTATNAAGLEATASFTVTVTPKAPPAGSPTVTVPADITTTATGASGAVVSYTATAEAAAGTTIATFSCTPASGSTFAIATTTVTCTAVGSNSKETKASFTVTVKDAAPVISGVPADISTEATGASGAAVSYTNPTATDFADGTDPVLCTPASGSTFAITTTTVKCTATNAAGLEATASFTVTVTPKAPPAGSPTVTVPADITTTATGASGAVVSYTATAEAAAGTTIATFSCTPASGSTFAIATTTVTCTAVASNSKETKASFTVTVKDAAPVISGVPADISTEATGASGAAVSYTNPTATDFADGTDPVLCTPASGSTFAITTTTVKCTATNAAGLEATASFTVTVTPKVGPPPPVEDKPVISGVPANITVAATSSSGAVVTYVNPTATDPVDGSDPVICVPASGSMFAITTTTVNCTATNKAGVKATASFTVTVTPQQVRTPAVEIHELLLEVQGAKIPHQIRSVLVALLENALRSLNSSQHGGGGLLSGYGGSPLSSLSSLQELSSSLKGIGPTQHGCQTRQASDDVALFIAVIRDDQGRRHRAQIPASLANAWIKTARGIDASLTCPPVGKSGSHGR